MYRDARPNRLNTCKLFMQYTNCGYWLSCTNEANVLLVKIIKNVVWCYQACRRLKAYVFYFQNNIKYCYIIKLSVLNNFHKALSRTMHTCSAGKQYKMSCLWLMWTNMLLIQATWTVAAKWWQQYVTATSKWLIHLYLLNNACADHICLAFKFPPQLHQQPSVYWAVGGMD